MNKRAKRQRLIAEINITPFTDVILVLLIIFMVTTPLIMQSSIKVNLPSAASAKSVKSPTRIDITMTNENLIYLDGKLVTREELKEKINIIRKTNPDVAVALASDKMARFKDIVAVLDILNESGVKNLNIMAETAKAD